MHVGPQHLAGAHVNGFLTMQGWKYWKVHGIQASLGFSMKRPLGLAPSFLHCVVAFVEISNRRYDYRGAVWSKQG